MKRTRVVVPWKEGLHLRPAAKLVRLGQKFRSTISLQCGERIANLRSILSVITLCAAMGTALDVEAAGEDEQDALAAMEAAFAPEERDDSGARLSR